jgi:exopolysaccharide biosynthesis protein
MFATDELGKPVVMYAMYADPEYISFHTGTPDDTYEYINKKQTVKGEAYAAIANGHDVIAAFNADFFDMFGNFSPSGVCVKNSRVVCGAHSGRSFFGVLGDNTPVISNFSENPEYLNKLKSAVSGREIFLRNGELHELSLLEAFGYVRHPRTCAGVLKDGRFLILVVDGRLPEHSNGASIVDLARIMQALGATDAINLDGGGSCTFLIKTEDDFNMLNIPADLHRPTAKLIREVYNTILLTKIK